ncbi:MAG: hypothetical protein ABW025_13595 [Cellulomonas sp.]
MAEDETPTLKLSEVSRRCGVEVEILRRLIEDGHLAGVVRGKSGHVYVHEAAVPSWHQTVALIEQQLRSHLARAKSALERVRVEIEAVGNDIELAIDDPLAELGDDLVALRTYTAGRDHTTLSSALHRLEMASWDVRIYSDALRRARSVR